MHQRVAEAERVCGHHFDNQELIVSALTHPSAAEGRPVSASYERLFGRKPAVTAIHAGLECGIIGSNYPGLDMISFGPTICYPHSPDEKVEIASVGKFYDFLTDTLRHIPEK